MPSATLDNPQESTKPQLTLSHLREAMYNGEASRHEDLDVLRDMATNKDEVLRSIESNPEIAKEFSDQEDLRQQFDALHQRYTAEIKTIAAAKDFQERAEKKGIFKRILSGVGSFAKKHPIVTALIVAGVIAGGVAVGFYLAGSWELLMTSIGSSKIASVARTIREMIPITPKTSPLPGGGVYDTPIPMPAPDVFPDIPH